MELVGHCLDWLMKVNVRWGLTQAVLQGVAGTCWKAAWSHAHAGPSGLMRVQV